MIIENVNKIKKVVVLTIEDDGFVKQEFEVSTKDDKEYFKQINSAFNPYITI